MQRLAMKLQDTCGFRELAGTRPEGSPPVLTMGSALIGIVLWGSLAGSMLPFLLRRIGIDPATSSAPFVATLVDVSGLIICFTAAGLILRGTLF